MTRKMMAPGGTFRMVYTPSPLAAAPMVVPTTMTRLSPRGTFVPAEDTRPVIVPCCAWTGTAAIRSQPPIAKQRCTASLLEHFALIWVASSARWDRTCNYRPPFRERAAIKRGPGNVRDHDEAHRLGS